MLLVLRYLIQTVHNGVPYKNVIDVYKFVISLFDSLVYKIKIINAVHKNIQRKKILNFSS